MQTAEAIWLNDRLLAGECRGCTADCNKRGTMRHKTQFMLNAITAWEASGVSVMPTLYDYTA
jgi:hypothetical protein